MERPLGVIKPSVDEKADPGRALFLVGWVAKVELVLCRVVRRGAKGVPPWFLDGEDVVFVDPRVAEERGHHRVFRFSNVVL